jgi:uncharacterized protein (DUF362 family)
MTAVGTTSEDFLNGRVTLWDVSGNASLATVIDSVISKAILPNDRHALILLKPNLNNDLIGLTGNSTDLRVLSCVVEVLKRKGYGNLAVVDAPNLGIARTGADVLRRLGVKALCDHLGVFCLDANRADGIEVKLDNSIVACVAKVFLDADCIINIPTIKTHAEVKLSGCLKNFIGMVIGKDKRKIHRDLVGSILGLHRLVPLALNIVDGLIGMEGDGPGDGRPRQFDCLLSGQDPYLIDAVLARFVGLEPFREVPYLAEARRQGVIQREDVEAIQRIRPKWTIIGPAARKFTTRTLGHWSTGLIRDSVRPVFDNSIVRPFLHRCRVVQDVYEVREAQVQFEFVASISCGDCSLCSYYCPMGLERDEMLNESKGCIQCGYCYWVCGAGKIRVVGDKGYLSRHIERYKALIENAVGSGRFEKAARKTPIL